MVSIKIGPGRGARFESHCKAPPQPGKYTAFFRLCHSKVIEFGEKVWVDFEVVEEPKKQLIEKFEDLKMDQSIFNDQDKEEGAPLIQEINSQQQIQIGAPVVLPPCVDDDKDKSMFLSEFPQVPEPMKMSVLKESDLEKITYVDKMGKYKFS